MTTHFHAGFVDELVKSAGIRDIVKRVVHGAPIPKMGFFERRRLAKALGVKGKDLERTLMERQRKDRLTKAMVAGGGLGVGSLAGMSLDKQADVPLTGKITAPKSPGGYDTTKYNPQQIGMMEKRDALMKSRGQGGGSPSPKYDTTKYNPQQIGMMEKRDALMRSRAPAAAPKPKYNPDQVALMKRRDDLMKSRQPAPAAKPPAFGAALAGSFARR